MSFTNFLEQKVLEHVFRNVAYTSPTALYVGLFTTTPSDSTAGTEVSGGSYARQTVAFSFTSGDPSSVTNTAQITFPTSTASWGTVTHAGIYDALTGGNFLAYAELTLSSDFATSNPKTIATGDIFRISAGNLQVRLT